jgi:hypothetical protein
VLGWFVGTLALVVGAVVGLGFSTEHTRQHQRELDAAYADAVDAAQADAAEHLHEKYGVTVAEPLLLPVDADVDDRIEVRFADGSTDTCLVGTYDDEYTIRCGSSAWEDATPLERAA